MALLLLRYRVPVLALLALAGVCGLFYAGDDAGDGNRHVVGAESCLAVNGHAALADRRYNAVAYMTTHNANASQAQHYFFPNQISGMAQQLADGVRALMIDVHRDNGVAMLCHGNCRFGKQDLVEGLGEVSAFMDAHPDEVVTILLEPTGVHAKTLARAFADSGLLKHAYAHNPAGPWPVLREMVETGQRLVVFTNQDTAGYPWLHAMWDYMWDTPWHVRSIEDFDCEWDRGDPDNDLFVLNHFITNPLPVPGAAQEANAAPVLLERALTCWRASGHIPNFVAVDYYELGDVRRVVDQLNSLADSGPPP